MTKSLDLQLFANERTDVQKKQVNNEEHHFKKREEIQLKYTDEDVDHIIHRKFSDWEKKHKKQVDEAVKLAQIDVKREAENERDQLRKELAYLKKEKRVNEMTAIACKLLHDESIYLPDKLVGILIGDTAEETAKTINVFIAVFKDAVQRSVKDVLKGNMPKTGNMPVIAEASLLLKK